jgi:hypothetical protein
MGLETGTTISQLDSTWPLGGDQKSQGDNHLRLIKSVLKTQFPGVGGLGYNTPITAKESDLNALPQLLLDRAAFFVIKNATQALSQNIETVLTWPVEEYDNKNAFSANQYTIPIGLAGLWMFGLTVGINLTTALTILTLKKNGTTVRIMPDAAGNNAYHLLSPLVVADNDVISTAVTVNTASTSANLNYTYFWGFKVI